MLIKIQKDLKNERYFLAFFTNKNKVKCLYKHTDTLINESHGKFGLLGIWIEIVFKFQFNNLFLSFAHLFIKGFKSLFQHCDGLLQRFNSFRESLFN